MQKLIQKLKEIALLAKTRKGKIVIGAALALWLILGWISATPTDVCWPKRGAAIDAVTGTVKVLAEVELAIKAPTTGSILSIITMPATGLAPVAKGELIAQMDTADVDREVVLFETSEKTLKKRIELGQPVEAEIQNARSDLATSESLYTAGQYSKADLERKQREVEKLERMWMTSQLELEGELATASYQLQNLRERRAQMTIASPIDGYFYDSVASPGQTVGGDSQLGKVRSKGLLMEVKIAEEDFFGIAAGQAVKLSFNGLGEPLDGTVSSVAATANPDTRQRIAFVKLNSPTDAIVPGSTGYATIIKAQRNNALIIPRRALVGDRVFVDFFGRIFSRKVRVGYQSFNTVEILEGVGDFERVALTGDSELKNGMGIRPNEVKPY